MHAFLPAMRLAMFPLLAVVASAVAAQPAPAPQTATLTAVPSFQSAFDGYQAFGSDKLIDWTVANQAVYQRGGWRAYAEAAAAEAPTETETEGKAVEPMSMSMPMPMPMPAAAPAAKAKP